MRSEQLHNLLYRRVCVILLSHRKRCAHMLLTPFSCLLAPGVAIYNYQKLQMIRAKAALTGSKDAEKGGSAAPTRDSGIASAKDALLSSGGANGEKGGYESGSYR